MKIDLDPVPKPRMTQRDRWAKRPSVVRYFQYCDDLREKLPNYTPPHAVYLKFFIAMPPSWSKKKRVLKLGKPHDQRPDIDNLVKSFLDALCEDDSYIYAIRAEKYWAEQGSIEIGSY